MLSKINRFRGNAGVRYVQRKGDSFRAGPFSLKIVKSDKPIKSKFAVVVSNKVTKSAVDRNRIRRRVYTTIENQLSDMKITGQITIGVFDKSVATIEHAELSKLLDDLFAKSGLK